MEARSGPLDDLLSHDLHAAAASGSAEFWISGSRIQSFRDRNRTICRGLGYGHRDAAGTARAVPERRPREYQLRAGINCAPNRPRRSRREFLGRRGVGNEQRTCCAAEQQCSDDDCACHDRSFSGAECRHAYWSAAIWRGFEALRQCNVCTRQRALRYPMGASEFANRLTSGIRAPEAEGSARVRER